jgi:leader peptidase (prepilin peptidase)/N-methyltransferase
MMEHSAVGGAVMVVIGAGLGWAMSVLAECIPARMQAEELAYLAEYAGETANRVPPSFGVQEQALHRHAPHLAMLMSAACLLIYLQVGWDVKLVPLTGFTAVVLCASRIDVQHRLLPDCLTMPLLWAGLIVNLHGWLVPLEDAVTGALMAHAVGWVASKGYRSIFKEDGMGMGDIKLLSASAAWMGWLGAASTMTVAGLAAIAVVVTERMLTGERRRSIPFGPFLGCGAFICLVFTQDRQFAALLWM